VYVAAVLAVWLLLRFAGDRWWFATVILFGPRWLCAVPLAVLVPAAGLIRPRLLWVLGATAIMVLGPVMGFCIPRARPAAADGPALRVLTCNLKGKCNDNAALARLIKETMPDIVALQGCWGEVRIRWPAGWHVCQVADFVVASRYPVVHQGADHYWSLPGHGLHMDMFCCTVQAAGRDIDFYSVHLLSPHRGLAAVLDRQTLLRPSDGPTLDAEIEQRRLESEDAHHFMRDRASPSILAGDFNMPVDSTIYRRYWAEFRDAFFDAGLGFGYTEWPYLRGRHFGVRIDHVLTGSGWRCRRCWVGPDVGSDHLPLLADLSLLTEPFGATEPVAGQ
jgi:endonuclease/exonuclease/phosphatase (EEP) superfamily protein YafD